MKRIRLFLGMLLITCMGFAQNPFSDYGYDVQMVTLTSGQFEESHDADRIVEIGNMRFDTKTGKIVGRIEEREVKEMDAQVVSRFISIDPHCERYYSISPYVYCNNNPIKYIDPDGRDIVIWYSKNDHFVFNGTNQSDAPKNDFVQAVITAYDYNVNNGGGESLKKITTNSKYKVNVVQTDLNSEAAGQRVYVKFNPEAGLQFEDGNSISPATILEHEFGHVVDRKEGTVDLTPDENYTNASEKKIIKGVELTTAKANGELPKNHPGRSSHKGSTRIVTRGVTSNKELSPERSRELRERIKKDTERRSREWTSEP